MKKSVLFSFFILFLFFIISFLNPKQAIAVDRCGPYKLGFCADTSDNHYGYDDANGKYDNDCPGYSDVCWYPKDNILQCGNNGVGTCARGDLSPVCGDRAQGGACSNKDAPGYQCCDLTHAAKAITDCDKAQGYCRADNNCGGKYQASGDAKGCTGNTPVCCLPPAGCDEYLNTCNAHPDSCCPISKDSRVKVLTQVR